MRKYVVWAAGIGYASIFGFSFLVTKGALDVLDPMELLFARFLVAAVAMGVLAAFGAIRLDFRGKPAGPLVLTCIFQPVIYFVCETFGVRESATSTAGLVLGALPASVAVLGMITLHERLGRFQTLGLALSVAGVALIVLSGTAGASGNAGAGTLRGFLMLFGSMVAAAFFSVFSRKASRHYTDAERTFAMMWTGAIVFGIIVLASGLARGGASPVIPGPVPAVAGQGRAAGEAARAAAGPGLASRMLSAWPALAYLGLLSSVAAFFLMNVTLTRVKASQSSVFTNLTTAITVVAGVVLRGEPFGVAQGLGAAMIVAGVWAANRAARPEPAGQGRAGGAGPASTVAK